MKLKGGGVALMAKQRVMPPRMIDVADRDYDIKLACVWPYRGFVQLTEPACLPKRCLRKLAVT
ncbi:MAG TPA: hypothetical protein PLW86_15420 [Rhodocyclaceae bacterium]|nr:hypothetical protein [Rhodocyclaceae bacterium]